MGSNFRRFSCMISVAIIKLTLYGPNSFFRRFSGHNLRYALFVYRLIGATLIGIILRIPSENRIKIFVKRTILRTLVTSGLIIAPF